MRALLVFTASYAVALFGQWLFFFDPFGWAYEHLLLERTATALAGVVWIVLAALAARWFGRKALWLIPAGLIMGWTLLGLAVQTVRCPNEACTF
jgi:hypothetical protein